MAPTMSLISLFAGASAVLGVEIEKKDVTIGGLKCDGIQTGTVFYPKDNSTKYPLLSFAHGWTEGGAFTNGNYKDVLETVASAGYVVVAHHSGLVKICFEVFPHDQQRALAFINETAEFSSRVDWNSKSGIYGHSMGGAATGKNAGDSEAIEKYNMGAAVLLHPGAQSGTSATKIPSFFATGSADTICPPKTTLGWSEKAAKPMIFAEMTGATHFECQSRENGLPEPHGWTNYVVNWFNCHLKGQKDECAAANAVCTKPTKPMTKTNCEPSVDSLQCSRSECSHDPSVWPTQNGGCCEHDENGREMTCACGDGGCGCITECWLHQGQQCSHDPSVWPAQNGGCCELSCHDGGRQCKIMTCACGDGGCQCIEKGSGPQLHNSTVVV